MRKWKLYEEVTGMIFKALSGNEQVSIRTDVEIPDFHGDDRQIDVIIEHEIAKIPVRIAVECRDYKDTISVSQIEAFHSKCLRLPGIHRMIFVTKTGYQSGAISAAKDFKIELYLLKDIEENNGILTNLDYYKFSIDKRVCGVHTIRAAVHGEDDLIIKEDKGYIIEFTNPIDRHNLWEFPKSFVYSMEFEEWKNYLQDELDGQLKNVAIRIIPNVQTNLIDSENNIIAQISCIDLYLSLSGEIISMDHSNSRTFHLLEKNESLAETRGLIGLSKTDEITYLNFVDAGDNIVRVTCSITENNKIKYENTELWEVHPSIVSELKT